jgi:hypothetical protein
MEIKELIIKNNPNAPKDGKRLIAFFIMEDGKTRRKKFGSANAFTYFDGATEQKRDAYLARHKVRENWNDIMTAGALAKEVLWTDTNRSKLEKLINRKFGIPKVKIQITKQKMK